MTELVAILSTGKGTWTDVIRVVSGTEWDKVFIITDEFGASTFQKKENMELIVIDVNDTIEVLIEKIRNGLKDKLMGPEVAINFVSGSGKEHMALLSALLKLGLGIRLVVYNNGLKEI